VTFAQRQASYFVYGMGTEIVAKYTLVYTYFA